MLDKHNVSGTLTRMKIKLLIAILVLASFSASAKLNEADCIKAVVGEAAGEPYLAKVAVSAVIRTRGSLKGIYGANAKHKESAATYLQCRKAWEESATNDPTHGCNLFGGFIDDKYFQGKLGLKPVLTIGHTRFYKTK